jgi:hypothetical protein
MNPEPLYTRGPLMQIILFLAIVGLGTIFAAGLFVGVVLTQMRW